MADFDAVLLSGETARKLGEQIRQVDAQHDNTRLPIGCEDGLNPQQVMAYYPEVVRITSTTQNGEGRFPGKLCSYAPASGGGAYTDLLTVQVERADTQSQTPDPTLSLSVHYPARAWGLANDGVTPVYQVWGGITASQVVVTATSCTSGTLSVTTHTLVFSGGILVDIT